MGRIFVAVAMFFAIVYGIMALAPVTQSPPKTKTAIVEAKKKKRTPPRPTKKKAQPVAKKKEQPKPKKTTPPPKKSQVVPPPAVPPPQKEPEVVPPPPQEEPEMASPDIPQSPDEPWEPENKDDYLFRTFSFTDYQLNRTELGHYILKAAIDDSEKSFGYSRQELCEEQKIAAARFNREHGKEFTVVFDEQCTSYRLSCRSDCGAQTDAVRALFKRTAQSYYKRKMFSYDPEVSISVNYRDIQKWQADYIRPLYERIEALAKKKQSSERDFLIMMVRLVQCMPYGEPPNEIGGKQTCGFWPPVICLRENAGDCDSKATLFASIYYHYQREGCVLILTGRHAFIGIKAQHRMFPKDRVVRMGGVDYLLAEMTNPREIGDVGEYLNQLTVGRFERIYFH
jgi:hypothetical protein